MEMLIKAFDEKRKEKKSGGLTEKLSYGNFKARIAFGRQTFRNDFDLSFVNDKLSDEKSTHTGMLQRIPGW